MTSPCEMLIAATVWWLAEHSDGEIQMSDPVNRVAFLLLFLGVRYHIRMPPLIPTFSSYISPNDIIVLAVSGGVDSMVLLDMIKNIHPKENIIVAHLDHCLR